MAKWLCAVAVLAAWLSLPGCGGGGGESTGQPTGAPPAGAAINNNDPRAKTAGPAPYDPSIPYPGTMKKKGGAR